MSKSIIPTLMVLILLSIGGYAQKFAPTNVNAKTIQPILEDSLRHPHIILASNGKYYLTATQGGKNWAYTNHIINVWSSNNLKHWKNEGAIWTGDDHLQFKLPKVALPNTYHSQKSDALRSPEIAEINNEFYLIYSQSAGGICIAKSSTQSIFGPYVNHAVLLSHGVDPSLFQDDDGTVYLCFNGGFVARLNDNLNQLEEHPVFIYPAIEQPKGWGLPPIIDRIGSYGARIFKKNGKYCISAGDAHWRMNTHCHDLFISQSTGDIYGPYNRRYMAVPHAGNGSVFQDKENNWWSTYCGNDAYALFHDQVGIVPLMSYDGTNDLILRPSQDVILENGPIGSCHPVDDLKNQFARDPSICIGHDGAYYMVCTIEKESMAPDGGIKMWRSTDLHNWDYLGFVWTWKNDAPDWLLSRALNDRFWAPEISYINNRYYIAVSLSEKPRGIMLLESEINQPQGKYSDPVGHTIANGIDGFLFKDDDGIVYFLWGNGFIAQMKNDMSGFVNEPWHIKDKNGTLLGYEGVGIIKFQNQYIIHAADHTGDHNGSYDMTYVVAKNLKGPYSERTVTLPHVGHTTIFRGNDQKLYCTIFGSTGNYAFNNRFGLLEIDISSDFKFTVKDTKIGY